MFFRGVMEGLVIFVNVMFFTEGGMSVRSVMRVYIMCRSFYCEEIWTLMIL